ncbi:MAG TPA: ABC transporter permease, partial [Vicinamibacterales bacterium]|nr:ABC transporter permease [Vicinamibacterales bacterium]
MLESVWRDVRYGARMLANTPGITAIAVLSIALGIGVNAAMFSLADGLALRPLQVPHSGDVVAVTVAANNDRDAFFGTDMGVSYPDYVDLRDRARSFTGLAAYSNVIASIADRADEPPRGSLGFAVTGNFFDVLQLRPALGRMFVPADDRVSAAPVIVLPYDTWSERFGGDLRVIGRHLRVGGIDATVIGVAPKEFPGMELVLQPAFYIPLAMVPSLPGMSPDSRTRRDVRSLAVTGRLRPGVSMPQAQDDIRRIAIGLERAYPDTNRRISFRVRSDLDERRESRGPATPAAWTLIALAGVVLLVACANVAGLLLSRASARLREISLRIALGGSRLRVARQLVTESTLIAVFGAGLGLAVADAAIRFLGRVQVVSDVGIRMTIALDHRVLAVALLATVVSALLAGVVPAWRMVQADDVAGTLKGGTAPSTTRSRLTGRNLLVASQVALALTVLTVGVFLYRTFEAEFGKPGFRTDHILMATFNPTIAGADAAKAEAFYRLLKDRVRQIPGVRSVGMTAVMPMNQDHRLRTGMVPEGYQLPPGTKDVRISFAQVDDGYFETLGVPIVRGRGFTSGDRADAPLVAIVNQTMAARYWPGQNPIGKRLRVSDWRDGWVQVVGVAADGKYNWIGEGPTPFVYLAESQGIGPWGTLLVASNADDAALASSIRATVRDLDPNMPLASLRTIEEWYYGSAVGVITGFVWTIASMGLLGVLLALVGLYGLVSYAARR